MRRVPIGTAVAAGLLLAAVARRPPAHAAAAASDGPGAPSHFDLARKDCLGTARNRKSKVWYTVADGVLSDVYYPTVDNTNVETLQYIVTDGSTFTDLQTRDMTYTVSALDDGGMACRVTTHRQERQLPHRHRLRHRPQARRRSSPRDVRAAGRLDLRLPPVRPLRPDRQRQRRRRLGQRRRPTPAPSTPRPAARSRSPPTRSPRPTRPTATTRSRCSPRSTPRRRSCRSPTASPARPATACPARRQPRADRVQRQRRHRATWCRPRRSTLPANGTFALALGFGADQADAVGDRRGVAAARLRPSCSRATPPTGRPTTPASTGPTSRRSARPARRPRSSARPTCSRPTCSRPPRTRRSPARSWPAWPRRGARRSRPATRQHLLRLLPRGVRPRPVRGLHRPAGRRRPGHRAGRRRSSCSTASSSPTARCRATAWSTASPRRTPSAPSSTRAPTRS